MPSLAVIGSQWGDEGKGKAVDYLAQSADVVVRFQGGPNAGHTVRVGDKQLVLHQIPTGILTPGVKCIIGCGCVIDPYVLTEELDRVRKWGVPIRQRLVVDVRAHMILPYHRLFDRLQEDQAGRQRIGTTGRGIGPAYQDKLARRGIRAADLLQEDVFKSKLKQNLAAANFKLMEQYKADPIPFKRLSDEYWQATRSLARVVGDGSLAVENALAQDERVIFEGAQGVHLDLDLGTYPYVTTSSTGVWGVGPGVGVSPLWLEEVVGVAKAYLTRVGMGPFPTEMSRSDAAELRELGSEYGATTGRPRRCGWFDAGLLRASVRQNRFKALIITKLDVLDSMRSLRLSTHYSRKGRNVREFNPVDADCLIPQYVSMPGWREPTNSCLAYRELPLRARRYLKRIEEAVECPVAMISVGSERRQMIVVNHRALKWLKSM